MDGFVGYRAPYDAKTAEYGNTDVFWDEDYSTGASCARCNRDATEFFQKSKVTIFYAPPVFKER